MGHVPSSHNAGSTHRIRTAAIAAALAVGTVIPAIQAGPASAAVRVTVPGGGEGDQFVRRIGAQLFLDGRPYRFAGTNNYYPMYQSTVAVDALFAKVKASGFDVIRVWGSREIGTVGGSDSVDPSQDGFYLQAWDPAAGAPVFNDGATGLQHLDYVLASARAHGVRLVIPFVNNWNNFGGMDQYVRWAGDTHHDDFYTDPKIRGWYQAWIAHLLDRVNPLTGIAYKDDPTVLGWELGNEPRCLGGGVYPRSASCTTDTLVSWADTMSRYVKSVDRRHLLDVGDEGFYAKDTASTDWTRNGGEGVDTIRLAALPAVDMLSLHLYPEGWGKPAAWGNDWIAEHLQDARKVGKPAFLGEFGLADKATRNPVYGSWTDTFVKGGGTGELYWIMSDVLADGTLYPDYDGFTVYCPSAVCTTLGNAARTLHHEGFTFRPVADNDTLVTAFQTVGTVSLTANDIAYLPGRIAPSTVDLDPATAGRQTELTTPLGTASVAADGTLTFTPGQGASGRTSLTYTVADTVGRKAPAATVTVIVKPDPAAAITLFSFEDGTQGWAEQNWSQLGGTVAQTTAFATDGTHGLAVNSMNEWFGAALPSAVDLSTKSTLKADLKTGDAGTSVSVVLQTGSSWDWCQGPFVWYGAGTTATVAQDLLTGLSCSSGSAPDLTQVHGIYLFFNAGTFLIDNIRAE